MKNPPKNHSSSKGLAVKTIEVSDLLRVEMLLIFINSSKYNKLFELYYLLVCCSDGGVLRNRKHSGDLIRRRLGLNRGSYDMAIKELKSMGLVVSVSGIFKIVGSEYINWDNMPEGILFKKKE